MQQVTAPLPSVLARGRGALGDVVNRLRGAPRPQLLVGILAALGGLLRLACWLRPYGALDRAYVPDDTYYTLTIARSLARGDGPTVDGSTLTSGFQALQGFLLVPVFWVVDGARMAAHLNLGVMFLADTALVVALGWLGYRLAGTVGAAVAAGLWAASPLALAMAAGGLETSLAMLIEASVVVAWVWAHDRPSTRRWVAVGALAGLVVLARVDALLLVALLVLLTLWRGDRRGLRTWAPVAAATLAPWWGWCWLTLGTPFPTSGEAAGALAPYDPFEPQMLAIVVGAVAGGPLGSLDATREGLLSHADAAARWYGVLLAALVALAAWWLRPFRPPRGERADIDAGAAAGTAVGTGTGTGTDDEPAGPTGVQAPAGDAGGMARLGAAALAAFGLGLCVFYAWYGLPWFAYRYLAPVCMTVTLAVAALAAGAVRWLRQGARLRAVVAAPVLGLVGVGAVATLWRGVEFVQVDRPDGFIGDADVGEYDPAERALTYVPDGARVGAWQSGALGYVADDRVTVVNLDGVVNPDAAEARAAGTLPEYVDDEDIDYLVDWAPFLIAYEYQRLHEGLPIDRPVAEVRTEGKDMSVYVLCCRDGDGGRAEREAVDVNGRETMPEG